jgi:hypothetical protein
MTQNEDVDYIGLMKEVMEEWYSKPRQGHHVSDVTLCPRQKVFREIDPVQITDNELNMYSPGRAIHEAVQFLFRSMRNRFEIEKYVEHENIEGSVDIYDRKKNVPIEFKTVRSDHVDQPRSFQVEQLKYYMSMLDSSTGYMLYQCLMNFEDKPWRIFKVTMNKQERKEQLSKLVTETESLRAAKKTKDPSLARHVYYDKNLSWLCKSCPIPTNVRR